jgi:hypothetical protein
MAERAGRMEGRREEADRYVQEGFYSRFLSEEQIEKN